MALIWINISRFPYGGWMFWGYDGIYLGDDMNGIELGE